MIGQRFACELEIASGPATIVGGRETRDFGLNSGGRPVKVDLELMPVFLSSRKVERLRR
jgi:hypothetical protein